MQVVKELLGPTAVLVQEPSTGVFQVVNTAGAAVPLGDAGSVGVAYNDTAGHIAIPVLTHTALLTKSSAGTDYTLGVPVASTDDFKRVRIISTTAAAHVVTAGAGLINGVTNGVATFGAAIGNSIELIAYQGVWYTINTPKGVTIS